MVKFYLLYDIKITLKSHFGCENVNLTIMYAML